MSTEQAAADLRDVVISDEYLDGIMALKVDAPDVFDQSVRRIDGALIDAYEGLWEAWRAAEKALQAAWDAAVDRPNAWYEPDESGDEDVANRRYPIARTPGHRDPIADLGKVIRAHDALLKERDALTARCEALEADRRRQDWMDAHDFGAS